MPHQCTACGRVFADGSKEMLSGCPDCGGNKFQYRPPGAAGDTDGDLSSGDGAGSSPDADAGDEAEPTTDADGVAGADAGGPAPSTGDEVVGSGRPDSSTPRGSGSSGAAGVDAGSNAATPDATDRPDAADAADPTPGAESRATDRDGQADDDSRSAAARASAAVKDLVGLGDDDPAGADAGTERAGVPAEDRAQADARSGVVDPDEIAAAADTGSDPTTDRDGAAEADAAGTEGPSRPDRPEGSRVVEPDGDERPSVDELRRELNDQFESIRIVNPGQYELNLMELYNRDEYIISLREDGRYVIEVADSWRSPDEE
jgi:predicted  nucleic acid-binding Zn-ribbon protein